MNITKIDDLIRTALIEVAFGGREKALHYLQEVQELVTKVIKEAERKPEDYQTDLSEYDTILGFLSKQDQFLIDMMEDPIKDTQRDGFWCMHRCRERGIQSIKVPAPKAVTDMYPAIETINAYPIALLKERFGH